MSSVLIGVIVFVCMILAVLVSVPIYIAVLGAASVGLLIVGGPDILIQQLSTGIATVSANYNYAVIPLFIVVGVLAGETALGGGIFAAGERWLGKIRGGLLYAVVLGNAVFGACSGISSAGSIVFAKVALPSLKKARYDEDLSLGVIVAAGVLSCLIPPSVGIMTFCLLTNQSVGMGLTTGLAGGIVMVVVMMAALFIYFRIRPKLVPEKSEKKYSIMEKLATLKLLAPVICLFVLIVGGAFFGWFPATVGGAIASVAIIIYGFGKRIGLKRMFWSIWEAAQMFTGIFVIIVGSSLFSRFVSVTGLAEGIVNVIAGSSFPPLLVMIIIVVFYALCGCVMERGFTLDDACRFAKMAEGVIDILMLKGPLIDETHPTQFDVETPYLYMAQKVKAVNPKVAVETVGGFLNPDTVETALKLGKADMVSMARTWISNEEYVRCVQEDRIDDIVPCLKCNKCHRTSHADPWVSYCSVNPRYGFSQLDDLGDKPATKKKKVAVIGGGPAGMEAACVCCDRGHEVTLFEKSDRLRNADSAIGGHRWEKCDVCARRLLLLRRDRRRCRDHRRRGDRRGDGHVSHKKG